MLEKCSVFAQVSKSTQFHTISCRHVHSFIKLKIITSYPGWQLTMGSGVLVEHHGCYVSYIACFFAILQNEID